MTNFNKLFSITCDLLTTFRGKEGENIVKDVLEIMNKSPSLKHFLYDFYYNIKAAKDD